MMRQYQQGIATLLITSILLSVALVVTLGSYKNLFYQIKRAQNEVKARQQHWEAEGGLECLFSYIKDDPSRIVGVIPVNHSNLDTLCKNTLNLSQINITDLTGGAYRINSISHNGWTQLSKMFSTQNSSGRGAIQTTSRLTTYGDLNIHPDAKGGINSDKQYECVSMTYKYSYTILGSPTAKYQTGAIRENSLYPGSPSGSCTSNTTTNITLINHDSKTKTDDPKNSDSELKDDFVHDSKVDPFQSFFGYKKTPENIAKVKASFPEAGRIVVSDAINCKSAIENAYKEVDKVWITGNCAIHGNLALQGGVVDQISLRINDAIYD